MNKLAKSLHRAQIAEKLNDQFSSLMYIWYYIYDDTTLRRMCRSNVTSTERSVDLRMRGPTTDDHIIYPTRLLAQGKYASMLTSLPISKSPPKSSEKIVSVSIRRDPRCWKISSKEDADDE